MSDHHQREILPQHVQWQEIVEPKILELKKRLLTTVSYKIGRLKEVANSKFCEIVSDIPLPFTFLPFITNPDPAAIALNALSLLAAGCILIDFGQDSVKIKNEIRQVTHILDRLQREVHANKSPQDIVAEITALMERHPIIFDNIPEQDLSLFQEQLVGFLKKNGRSSGHDDFHRLRHLLEGYQQHGCPDLSDVDLPEHADHTAHKHDEKPSIFSRIFAESAALPKALYVMATLPARRRESFDALHHAKCLLKYAKAHNAKPSNDNKRIDHQAIRSIERRIARMEDHQHITNRSLRTYCLTSMSAFVQGGLTAAKCLAVAKGQAEWGVLDAVNPIAFGFGLQPVYVSQRQVNRTYEAGKVKFKNLRKAGRVLEDELHEKAGLIVALV